MKADKIYIVLVAVDYGNNYGVDGYFELEEDAKKYVEHMENEGKQEINRNDLSFTYEIAKNLKK